MNDDTPVRRDIVLVGGGHAHVDVLKRFGMKPEPGVRLNLISPTSMTPYSGMLPGYLAGHYDLAAAHIDLGPLTRFAGARHYRTAATGIDLAAGLVQCEGRPPVSFDLLSLDIGSAPSTVGIEGVEHAIPIKPVDAFLDRWMAVEEEILAGGTSPHHLVVIGAGAGGVEAALALNHRVRSALAAVGQDAARFRVSVVSRSAAPMETHSRGTRNRMVRALDQNGVAFHGGRTVLRISENRLDCEGDFSVDFDSAVLVTPGGAAGWLEGTGLELDDRGFVVVGETLQSVTDPRVFAAGDTIAFAPRGLPKSGVYAVRAGPVLADNLRRAATELQPRPFRPQRRTLALVSMGQKRAVLSYGALTAEGGWAWRFKDWIDRRWMRRYQELPDMSEEVGDTESSTGQLDPMRCGGCGAKVPSDILHRVLDRVAPGGNVDGLLVGLDAPDDAAVLTPPAGKALIQTVDQFRSFIEDPYLFGRIAANHCLGDIYAMGATPSSALTTITLPFADDAKMEQDLEQLMRGALATLSDARVGLVGGHTGEGADMALGFTINAFGDPASLLRKSGLKPGDRILLTKPLGTGVLLAADMRHAARGEWVDGAIDTMLKSNELASGVARKHGATAATDVTGFGLAGHLAEMAEASEVSIPLDRQALPVLDGAVELFGSGFASSLQPANQRAMANVTVTQPDLEETPILFDPQTAGGLVFGVPADAADACLTELRRAGYDKAADIGEVSEADVSHPRISLV